MTSSVSGQNEPNLALGLATRAGKMELSCPLGIRALSRKENLSFFGVLSHIINPLLTKPVRSRWLDFGSIFFACLWTSTSSRSISTQKKNLANIQPSWPHAWSNNPYIFLTQWGLRKGKKCMTAEILGTTSQNVSLYTCGGAPELGFDVDCYLATCYQATSQ